MKLNNNRGYSMIELLAAIVVGVLVSYATYSYITYISNLTAQLRLTRSSNDNVQAIIESIRFNLSLYQVSFETDMKKEAEIMKRDVLPYGFSNGTMVPREECVTKPCQAYFGYVIVPSLFVRNLYQVDLKVALPPDKRKPVNSQEERWKQYTYFITVK